MFSDPDFSPCSDTSSSKWSSLSRRLGENCANVCEKLNQTLAVSLEVLQLHTLSISSSCAFIMNWLLRLSCGSFSSN